jgi:GAF domain
MQDLTTLTTFINLLSLAAALWLGFYIVTRSPHGLLSWLAAVTLWLLGSYFLCNALVLNSPPTGLLSWLRQLVLLVMPLWLHLTYRLEAERGQALAHRLSAVNRVAIPLAYLAAIALIAIGVLPTTPPVGLIGSTASEFQPAQLGYGSRGVGAVYLLFIADVLVFGALSLVNLWEARQEMRGRVLDKPSNSLFIATTLAAAGALYSGVITSFGLHVPTFPTDIALGAGVFLLGYAVARHASLLEGRPLDRDFVYAILVVGSLTVFYVLIVFIFFLAGQVSFLTLVLTIVGTVAANSLFDGIRLALDRLFYRRQFQQLRSNLRELAREAGTGETLPHRLQAILAALCRALRIRQALIALAGEDGYVVKASKDANPVGQILPASALAAHETIGLVRSARIGLPGMTLLIPLFAGGNQTGAVVLGPKETQEPYDDADLDLLEDLGDQIAGVIHSVGMQEENARAINALVQDFRGKERALQLQVQQMLAAREQEAKPLVEGLSEETLLPMVEEALRHLYDFSYLGEQELSKLRVVERRLADRQGSSLTFIDRGKALSETLVQAVNRLRPDEPEPGRDQVPPREWHQFIILHDSYVAGEPNRNIMSKLYIGEGTFNRTRRRALRGVAKSLAELEEMACRESEDSALFPAPAEH